MRLKTHSLGYPRIGERRELKRALEGYWQGRLVAEELDEAGRAVRRAGWRAQKEAGLEGIPSNDFTFYDHVLDTSCLVGNVPERFGWRGGLVSRNLQFALARGSESEAGCGCASSASACEMTKWFDTNYH